MVKAWLVARLEDQQRKQEAWGWKGEKRSNCGYTNENCGWSMCYAVFK